jgi:hypothetical protein
MGGQDPLRPDTAGFCFQGGVTELPRRPLKAAPLFPGGRLYTARGRGDNPAGKTPGFAKLQRRLGIPPAFFPGTNSVIHMEAVEFKPEFPPERIQGGSHGGGIGASGKGGEKNRTLGPVSQPCGNGRFKITDNG